MLYRDLIQWLLRGDVSIQYQVHQDLLNKERPGLRKRIGTEGWGARYLAKRKSDGYWGKSFYQPKWISTHYTLLDLKNLKIDPNHRLIRESVNLIADREKGSDGGVNPSRSIEVSDVCVNGMFLNYASYFKIEESKLQAIVDQVLSQHMRDGGFNCMSNRSGAKHSSLHTTLSVLEGITEYDRNGYQYRLEELQRAKEASIAFILLHQLFISDRTGEIIKKAFLRLSYPSRWFYDILRALDYLQYSRTPWDERMIPAVQVLLRKRKKEGTWNLQAKYSGLTHFEMEKAGKPSRWNTLRAMRVFKHFGIKTDRSGKATDVALSESY